jgi:hypothetical protein
VTASNVFIAKLNPAGSALIYSTLLGGSGSQGDVAYGLAVDSAGDAYVAGFTSSSDFPVSTNAFQSKNNGTARAVDNAFVAEINPTATELLYSTYLGGTGSENPVTSTYLGDVGYAIAIDASSNIYTTGSAASADFPTTTGAFQTVNKAAAGGEPTAFVAKFGLATSGTSGTQTTLISDGNPQSAGVKVTFTAYVQSSSGGGVPTGAVSFSVDGGTGTSVALDGTGHASYAISTLTAGMHTITASYSGDTNYAASSATLTETITGTASSISVVSGSGQTTPYGSAFASPLVVIVKDANGNPVASAVVSFSGTGVNFSSGTATTGSNGEASVTATAAATGSLTASASTSGASLPVTFNLSGTKASQNITFNTIPTEAAGTTITLTASATSGLAVSFTSITPGVCAVSGTTATLPNPGTCTIQASQTGNANYTAATPVSQSFSVSSAANFTITPIPPQEIIRRGELGVFILQLKSVDGFDGEVRLSCDGGPEGSKCTDFPRVVPVHGTEYAISGIRFPEHTTPGTYTITFIGVSGSLVDTATAEFIVK